MYTGNYYINGLARIGQDIKDKDFFECADAVKAYAEQEDTSVEMQIMIYSNGDLYSAYSSKWTKKGWKWKCIKGMDFDIND